MNNRIIIVGASGMIGGEILKQSLSSNMVSEVISFVRKKSETEHPKLKEIVVKNFLDYSDYSSYFTNVNAAYFCIGVYTGQVDDAQFKTITVDYAIAFAKQVQMESPKARLCLLSGAGADRTELSKTSFAKYKGMAENQISNLNMEFYSFRPGYIFPETPRNEPNIMYKLMRVFYPLLKLFGNKFSIPSTQLANSMFSIGIHGFNQQILENIDIVNEYNSRT